MSNDIRTENDTVAETATLAAVPQPVEAGKLYLAPDSDGGRELWNFTGDDYRDFPARKQGLVIVRDVAAFAQYHAKHADEFSEVYADLDKGTVTAVLDAHTIKGARWGNHRLHLQLTPTEPWKRWIAQDRAYLPQVAFADFLEDNLSDIAPDPVDAASMLEVATTFQAKTRVSFSSGTVLSSGAISLKYEETSDASGGAKGDMVVPKQFAVALAPFDDVAPYKVGARLRHRIDGSALKLCYILDRPQDVVRDAVKAVVDQVQDATGITVMRGNPIS
jgi:uncharacterized protein YfdQ (DUF2303 family)